MPEYTRELSYRRPLITGPDVLAAQRRLLQEGHAEVDPPDGLFDPRTERAVRRFQKASGLTVNGILGRETWEVLFARQTPPRVLDAPPQIASVLPLLRQPRAFENSVTWRLTSKGVSIDDGLPDVTSGTPSTVERVWNEFDDDIIRWCTYFVVPVELIIATICTESGGRADASRREPGFTSEELTPHRVSTGLMQTLISTAREALDDPAVHGAWLLEPGNSIKAGTAYIAKQWSVTQYDPPKVACAYNAGGIYHNRSENNRWKMRQYPIGSSHHADRFVKWFNDCFRFFAREMIAPTPGFYAVLNSPE